MKLIWKSSFEPVRPSYNMTRKWYILTYFRQNVSLTSTSTMKPEDRTFGKNLQTVRDFAPFFSDTRQIHIAFLHHLRSHGSPGIFNALAKQALSTSFYPVLCIRFTIRRVTLAITDDVLFGINYSVDLAFGRKSIIFAFRKAMAGCLARLRHIHINDSFIISNIVKLQKPTSSLTRPHLATAYIKSSHSARRSNLW